MYLNIKTERLNIRPLQESDAPFILELLNTEGWKKNIGDRNIHKLADAEVYIKSIISADWRFYHVFEISESNEAIGLVTFLIRPEYEFPDIGYAILPAYEGKGYTYEASYAFLEKIIENKNCSSIIGICSPHNTASINLLKKLGLQNAGTIIEKNTNNELVLMKGTFK
jgi:[ribosomal protein S5]-alanine N-acetyltransferase